MLNPFTPMSDWSISNFPCSSTSNIAPHGMKNLAYSDEKWYCQFNSRYLSYISSQKAQRVGRMIPFELGSEKLELLWNAWNYLWFQDSQCRNVLFGISGSHQSMNAGHPQRGRGQKRKTSPQKAYAKQKQQFKRRSPTEPRTSRSPHKYSPDLTSGDMRALAKRDPVKIVKRLSRSIKSFQKILNQKIMLEDDIFCDVITVVGKACEAPSAEQLNEILAALKNTTFLGEGIKHYLQRRHLGNETSEKLDMGILRDLIKLFSTYLHRLPSSFADVPIEEMENTYEVLEFDGKDDILGRLAKLKEERNQAIKEHREKTKPQKRRHLSQGPPPEDFREIPIRPSVEEVASDREPFLREHIMKGRFDSPEHYLDVQFRLLREDFVYPLRKGLAEVVNNTPRHLREEKMKLYNGVKILKKDYTKNGIVFKVQFNANPFKTTNWNSSKRLIFGSFLCFSKDNFKTMIFATVAKRDPDELKRGQLDIQFLEDQDVYGIEECNDAYVMAESPTYFESCRHVLSGLQNMDEESLPFKKYLVNCSSDVNPPEYLRREEGQEPVHYDLTQVLKIPRKTVEVLQPEDWPCADDVCLNSSQLQAFQAALTKEFCVIQGPPGTGKTYVGAKIVECLLKNRRFWDPGRNSPMLMVCYTNHALDQFLEKVLDFLPAGIIRVGSRSKNENLAPFNLKSSVRGHYKAAECGRDESIEEIRDKEDALDRLERRIPNFEQLEGIMNARHACQFHKGIDGITEAKDAFKVWICNKDMNIPVRSTNQGGGDGCLRRGTIGRPQKEENDNDTEDQYTNAVEDHDHKQRSEDGKIRDDVEYQWPDRYTPCYTTETTPETLASTPGTRGENVGEFAYVLQTASKSSLPPPIGVRDAVISSTVTGSVENSTHDRPPLEKGSSILIGLSEQSCQSMTTTQLADLSNKERMTFDEYEPQMEMNEDETNPEQQPPDNESSTQLENPGKSSLFTTSQHSDAVVPSCSAQEFFWLHEGTDDDIKTEPREPENPLEELDTIDIEHEADVLQRRRYLAGEEEDFLPLMRTRSKKEGHYDDGKEDEEYVVIADWQADPSSEPSGTARLTCLSTGIETPGGDGIEHLESNRSLGDDSDQRWQMFYPSKREHKSKKPSISAEDMANAARDCMKQQQAAMPAEEVTQIEDVWSLQANDRRRLYWYWMSCYRQKCIIDIREEEKAYEWHCKGSKRVKNEEEERALRRATVIGMTTTGAARYHEILRRIQPKIVVIEEAAEVLEAHIVTSLTPGTQHVIMIGDHKQLRPKAKVYELAQKYNLQISLFERMVLNEMDCKRLSTQHRMRPEIAQLTKRIYNHEITDHESVCRFQDVRGLQENLFFVDHQSPEKFVAGLQSYSNKHEADFIVALCHYLLLQGYKPEQITVLTMYTGQLLELKQLMPRSKFEGVRISVVDNFQGEENDIILLSLVRSSTIGFLKESNRICVALSRAREGFYCVGHFTLLTSNCQLWKDICEEMKTKAQMGTALKLICRKHDKSVDARLSEDFRKFPDGGCGTVCDDRLECGHVCGRKCHPRDPSHRKYRCRKPCLEKCANDHPCNKLCHHPVECDECTYMVTKVFPACMHEIKTECGIDISTIMCERPCERNLPCMHHCPCACGEACDRSTCRVQVMKLLPCGHQAFLPCLRDPASVRCIQPIEAPLSCGHVKRVKCHKKSDPGVCNEKYEKTLPCGHEALLECHVDPEMYTCDVMVDRDPQCGHQVKAKCHLESQEIVCKATVETELKCGHLKTVDCMTASKGLDVPCNVKVQRPLPCGHQKIVQCSRDVSREVCKLACDKTLECGHRCQENCGKACRCKEKTKKFLSCGHDAFLECCVNVQTFPCPMKCKRLIECGHACPGKCFEICAEQLCQKNVTKRLCRRQHRYILPCHKDPSVLPCPTKVKVSFPCGHSAKVPCFQADKAICQVPCKKRRPCNHRCRGLCSEPCSSSPCKEVVNRQLRCGHIVTMQCCDSPGAVKCPAVCGFQLACGHNCMGKCSDCIMRGYHEVCQRPCTRKLVCSHRCRATCGVPCPPCAERCERRCEHRKCNNGCMEDCEPCPMPCEKKCLHTQCNNLCSESCARTACDAPCLESLSCRHSCIGLCGENCPTLCRKCHASALETSGSNTDKKPRFVQLIDCTHVIEVRRMDEWMQRPLTNVQPRQCPLCMNPVRNSPRYGNVIKRSFKDVLSVIHEAEEAAVAVEESIEFLVREIKMFGRRPWLMNFPDDVQNLVEPMFYFPGVRKCTHLEYLYSCKNHLEIMRDISATLYDLEPTAITFLCVKEKVPRPEQSGVEFILDGCKRALERIEELISQPEFNLRRLSILHNHVRKFRVTVQFIDARCALDGSGKRLDRPGEAKVRDQMQRVASLVRGRPEFVDLQKLLDVVNDLRTRSQQPPLSMPPPVRMVNFPGFSRDSWFKCEKGHVYATQSIVCDVTETEVRKCRLCASQTWTGRCGVT